jgi:hypothetical protein
MKNAVHGSRVVGAATFAGPHTTVSADAANAMRTLGTMCATTVQPERLGSSHLM